MKLRQPKWDRLFMELALLERNEKQRAVEAMLRQLTERATLLATLDEFTQSVQESAHDQTDSYMHDNGFAKIVLWQDPVTKMKLRLHIWRPLKDAGVKRPRQNVHNHRWDFSSSIIVGSSDHLTYRFAIGDEPGEEFFHYRYYARGSKEHYVVEERGKARIVLVASDPLAAGMVYSVKNEALHRVDIPDDQLVATLIITHENVGWVTNDLLSERGMGKERATHASPMMSRDALLDNIAGVRCAVSL